MKKTEEFDYLVVGSGSSGSVVAGRLASESGARVLLLEAGGDNRSLLVRMPKGIARLVLKPEYTWQYAVPGNPDTGRTDEVWLRGKGLGGSSAINGMIWSRGHPSDYGRWEAVAGSDWGWQNMLAAYRAVEDHELGESDLRGGGGPVTISSGSYRYPLTRRMISAGKEMGLQVCPDLNDSPAPRVGYYSHNIRRGRRVSAADAYVTAASRDSGLMVWTGAQVQRVLFDGDRACGVEVIHNGRRQTVGARREVIVCAGALESPRLLQLSGIGPEPVLREAGVAPLVVSPDVGRRLREHLAISMPFRIKEAGGNHRSFHGLGLAASVTNYALRRRGALATGPFEVGAFARIGEGPGDPDLQLYFGGFTFAMSDDHHPVPLSQIDRNPGLTIYGQLLQLESEGDLRIASAKPEDAPLIRPNWLATERDRRMAVEALRYMREYAGQPALKSVIIDELSPGAAVREDADLLRSFHELATCGLHATGTCRMGRDVDSVVDERLRVRGVRGLRVVDCSVMPSPVSGNTNAPAIAAGYIAADMIMGDAA